MLESILKFAEVDKSPYLTFVWGLLITSIGILLSTQLSYQIPVRGEIVNLTGLFAVMFTIIPAVYLITTVIKKEEQIEQHAMERHMKQNFFRRHAKDGMFFLFFFFGVTIAFAIWSFILPQEAFMVQLIKITDIRGGATGMALVKGSFDSFLGVFANNTQVLLFSYVFSLLFGAGAVFILVWNASVLGIFIGNISKSLFEIPIQIIPYLPHGILEIGGYIAAALAGGLLSAAILRSHRKEILVKIFLDTMIILGIGFFLVFLGAVVEVYL
jgi:uncharacterized membrane protein SpoIIM required for sporulation